MTALAQTWHTWRPSFVSTPGRWSWGYFPIFTLTVTAGLTAVALGDRAGNDSQWWSELAFYAGLLLIVLPIGLRLLMPGAEGTERVSLVVLLAVALFLCKVLHDPLQVRGYDEFLHWRTAEDIMRTGAIFSPNSLLGVSPYYPGLELATTALSSISGMPIFESGIVVLASARIVFLLSLFFFFAMASGSARMAGIACLVYMTNPKFLYFNSQFSYESLALPLAAMVLYLLARRAHSGPARWAGLTIITAVTLPALVVTHHVTTAMLFGFLVLWAIVALVMRRRERARPGRVALATLVLFAGWTLLVATATIGYLAPALTSTVFEIMRLALGEIEARQIFVSKAGDIAPLWERLVGSASAGIILLLIPIGLLVVWRRYRGSPLMIALALAACAFPLTLIARLTAVGAEVSSRTPEFLYLGIGIIVALALGSLAYRGRRGILQSAAAVVMLSVLVVGGVLVGLPPWARVPGPYLVSADGRSVESEGITAAEWARDVLGPGNIFVADRVNRILMSTYGQQNLVTTYETRLPVRALYLSSDFGPRVREIVIKGDIKYLVVDRRLATAPPVVGHYFDRGEKARRGDEADQPLDPQLLGKFDRDPQVSRIFDSGNIQLYDVSGLAETPETTP